MGTACTVVWSCREGCVSTHSALAARCPCTATDPACLLSSAQAAGWLLGDPRASTSLQSVLPLLMSSSAVCVPVPVPNEKAESCAVSHGKPPLLPAACCCCRLLLLGDRHTLVWWKSISVFPSKGSRNQSFSLSNANHLFQSASAAAVISSEQPSASTRPAPAAPFSSALSAAEAGTDEPGERSHIFFTFYMSFIQLALLKKGIGTCSSTRALSSLWARTEVESSKPRLSFRLNKPKIALILFFLADVARS